MIKVKQWGKIFLSAFFLFILLVASKNAFASGFAVYTQGASALGQGNSEIAHTNGPASIFFNPALINELEGTQITLGTTLISPSREFTSDSTGNAREARSTINFPSTIYLTHKYNEKFSSGIGIFNPFGLGNDWGDNWEGASLTTNSQMRTFNINPVLAYRITPSLSLAGGLDLMLVDATLEKSTTKMEGDGNGAGYNLGILFAVNPDVVIGASYRSEITVDLDGDLYIKSSSTTLGAKTEITLPQQIHAGIAYKGFDSLILEAGFRWEGWSSYDSLIINLANGTTSIDQKNWKDVYAFNVGGQYQLNDSVALRAGFLAGGNAVPDSTFKPDIPDSDTRLITLGTGFKFDNSRVDLAYGYQVLESRNKSANIHGSAANGKYETSLQMFSANFTYLF